MVRFWHPVSDMHAVSATGELILDRGEGVHVWDDEGKRYLDCDGGALVLQRRLRPRRDRRCGCGAAPPPAGLLALRRRLGRPTTDLAERISPIAPMDDAAVFFTSGGGEAVETAVKLVRRYWSLRGEPRADGDRLPRARVSRPRRLRHAHRRHGHVQGRASARSPATRSASPGTTRTRSRRRSTRPAPSTSPPSSASRSSAPAESSCHRRGTSRRRDASAGSTACSSSRTR